ncbi:Uncharacterized protein OS=Pseudomonas protegens Cab57 GN=PPC_3785 PE=4 SV=1 [Gemmata massiliana]|uniref:Uncharacterized protein n=1 Tax=Gemmata massiliana TaxID=1210884 RepID=A0A6P2D1A7_9BACT|nr:hypothetical protein [Gemmata massiliana]VTR93240.1 Uncharacterized protein OS=Pseudomonas protegens Cab57 GN=PPC_3785 PE=4 SV=1 [Gemmata massiliana]
MGTRLYPPDHATALARALRVVEIVGARPESSNDEIVRQLVSEGVGAVDAELLVQLVPEALAWSVCRRLGATELLPYYSVSNARGKSVLFLLAEEHYFTAAVVWAEGVLNTPLEERPVSQAFIATVARSSINDAATRKMDQHGPDSLRGCVFATALGGVTAEQIRESRRDPNWRWWRFWK